MISYESAGEKVLVLYFIVNIVVFWKCLNKSIWAVNLVGVFGGLVVLASDARIVKEMCDSSQSVLRVLTKVVSFPYN